MLTTIALMIQINCLALLFTWTCQHGWGILINYLTMKLQNFAVRFMTLSKMPELVWHVTRIIKSVNLKTKEISTKLRLIWLKMVRLITLIQYCMLKYHLVDFIAFSTKNTKLSNKDVKVIFNLKVSLLQIDSHQTINQTARNQKTLMICG